MFFFCTAVKWKYCTLYLYDPLLCDCTW